MSVCWDQFGAFVLWLGKLEAAVAVPKVFRDNCSENFDCPGSFGSAKTDLVRFTWGFGEGLLKDKFAFFEACKKGACKKPILISKKGPV